MSSSKTDEDAFFSNSAIQESMSQVAMNFLRVLENRPSPQSASSPSKPKVKTLTLPQQRLHELSLTTVQVARKMNVGQRLTKRQLETRALTVARVLKHGNCSADYARRLARIIGVDSNFLELPRQCWPATWRGMEAHASTEVSTSQGAVATPHSTSTAGDTNQSASAGPRRPSPSRLEILRLVPNEQTIEVTA